MRGSVGVVGQAGLSWVYGWMMRDMYIDACVLLVLIIVVVIIS